MVHTVSERVRMLGLVLLVTGLKRKDLDLCALGKDIIEISKEIPNGIPTPEFSQN